MSILRTLSRGSAALACLGLAASPVMGAASMTPGHRTAALPIENAAAPVSMEQMNGWRGDRDWRGNRNWRGGHRHRNGIGAGDIFAGILVLGGIAAIASAASKDKQRREDARRDDWYDRDADRDPNGDHRSGMSAAVENCADAAERSAGGGARVEAIRSVRRDGAGWNVEGDLSGASEDEFLCGTGPNGQVEFVQLGDETVAMAD